MKDDEKVEAKKKAEGKNMENLPKNALKRTVLSLQKATGYVNGRQ